MVGVQSGLEGLVRTFGPFLIPVTVFAIGVVGYTVLFLASRHLRPDEDAGVVNLSAGTPERSATGEDHGVSTRGVVPYGGDEPDPGEQGAGRDGAGTDGERGTEDGEAGSPADDGPRHND